MFKDKRAMVPVLCWFEVRRELYPPLLPLLLDPLVLRPSVSAKYKHIKTNLY